MAGCGSTWSARSLAAEDEKKEQKTIPGDDVSTKDGYANEVQPEAGEVPPPPPASSNPPARTSLLFIYFATKTAVDNAKKKDNQSPPLFSVFNQRSAPKKRWMIHPTNHHHPPPSFFFSKTNVDHLLTSLHYGALSFIGCFHFIFSSSLTSKREQRPWPLNLSPEKQQQQQQQQQQQHGVHHG